MTAMKDYLAEHHPQAFGDVIRPLAAGIYERIVEQSPDIDASELDAYLGGYTNSTAYLTALMMSDNTQRVSLNGTPAAKIQQRDKDMALVSLQKIVQSDSNEMSSFRAKQRQWVSEQLLKGLSSKSIRKMRPIRSALIADVRANLDVASFDSAPLPQDSQAIIGVLARKNRSGAEHQAQGVHTKRASHSIRHQVDVSPSGMTVKKKQPVIIIKKSRSRAASIAAQSLHS